MCAEHIQHSEGQMDKGETRDGAWARWQALRAAGALSAVSLVLAACGGGGSGSGGASSSATTTLPVLNPNPTDLLPTTPTSPDVVITTGSAVHATLLSTDLVTSHVGDTDRAPQVMNTPVWSLAGNSNGLVLSTPGGGSLRSGLFLGDLSLPATAISLSPSTQTVQDLRSKQFTGGSRVGSYNHYGATVQWFTESGITAVGLGHWKYIGDNQAALSASFFNSGRQLARGAFLVGTPTPASAVAKLTSGRYQGVWQSAVDDGRYDNDFAQLTAQVAIDVDADHHWVTLRADGAQLLGGAMAQPGVNVGWTPGTGVSWMPGAALCSGPLDPATGRFVCTFENLMSGTAQGQLFGAQGEQLAATFSLSTPGYSINIHPVLVGGLAARRVAGALAAGSNGVWPLNLTALSFDKTTSSVSGEVSVRVNAASWTASQVKAVALDPQGRILARVTVEAAPDTSGVLLLKLRAVGPNAVGQAQGALSLRLCEDDPVVCLSPVNGSPWTLPYTVTTRP
jgi:hypothetical protein